MGTRSWTSAVLTAGVALASGLAGPTSLGAQATREWEVHVNPYVGVLVFDDSELNEVGREANIGPLLGGRVTVPLSRAWWVEGAYGYAALTVEPSDSRDPQAAADHDLGVHLFYGAAGYLIGSREVPTRLLLSAGLGGITLQPEGDDSTTHFLATVGVGFTHPVNDWITFRGDARDLVEFCREDDASGAFRACLNDEALNHIEVSGGLQFKVR